MKKFLDFIVGLLCCKTGILMPATRRYRVKIIKWKSKERRGDKGRTGNSKKRRRKRVRKYLFMTIRDRIRLLISLLRIKNISYRVRKISGD